MSLTPDSEIYRYFNFEFVKEKVNVSAATIEE